MFFDPGCLVVESNRRDAVRGSLHLRQRKVREDRAQKRLLRCSRRSGKTWFALTDIIDDHWDYPGAEYAYVALTRSSARNIAWPIIRQLNRKYGLQLRLRESIGRIEFPNDAALTIYGGDRDDWAERIYGQKLRKVFIDEASWFRGVDMNYLVNDVCIPTIVDLRGQITLMSIPSPYMSGLYWDADQGIKPGWSCHRWTWMQNPAIRQQTLEFIRNELALDPKWLELPGVRRNWFNEWVDEVGTRVYRWTHSLNSIAEYPITLENVTDHRFVLGVDFGWTHRTGFVMYCWTDKSPTLIELDSYAQEEMTLDEINDRCQAYLRAYPGARILGDPDAQREFGELTRRYGLPIEPAEKANKKFWIDLYNTELQAGRIKVVDAENSAHVDEMLKGRWESKKGVLIRNTRQELVEAKGWRNDCCDAGLYGFRDVWNYRYRKPTAPPEPGSAEWFRLLEEDMMKEAEERSEEGN